ncbi:DUF2624 domain-containing protein [Robertmurraya korlensis]|uniref:DUF2624 domain-containing protein n=1 Tax=Robertmurraya korlensis TaxID=519977 RepID=UPI00082480C3|nr:DUF2624 domain-containing protein [Robertmurraya korlensis]
MSIFQSIVNHKINTITTEELMRYGKQFGVSISEKEAKQIAAYLRGRNVDIFNISERGRLLKEIEKLTSPQTAKAVSQVVTQFTK